VPESIVQKPTPLDSTGQVKMASSDPPVLISDSSPSTLNFPGIDLKQLSQAPKINDTPLTVAGLNELKAQRSNQNTRTNAMLGLNLFGVVTSLAAGIANLATGGEGAATKAIDSLANKVVKGNFIGLAGFGAADAARRKSPQIAPQALAIFTPLLSGAKDLTMNRGGEVGSMTLAAGIEQLGGGKKEGYTNFAESVDLTKSAFAKFFKALKENPIQAILDTKNGTGAMFTGIATMVAPLIHHMGFEKIASIIRQGFGIALEFASKLNLENLKKGRFALFFSGLLMTVSSGFNLFKPFAPERIQKSIENFTWAFNLVGKQAQLQAYNSGELAYTQDHEFNLSELPSKMFNAILGRTNQATEAPVIGNAVGETTTEANSSSSNIKNSSSQQSFAPRANLNVSGKQNSDSQLQISANSNNTVTKAHKGKTPFIAAAAKLHAQKVPRLPRSSGTGAYFGSLDGPKAELVGVRAQKSDGNRFERQQMQVAGASSSGIKLRVDASSQSSLSQPVSSQPRSGNTSSVAPLKAVQLKSTAIANKPFTLGGKSQSTNTTSNRSTKSSVGN
jgi:hypothetical protein